MTFTLHFYYCTTLFGARNTFSTAQHFRVCFEPTGSIPFGPSVSLEALPTPASSNRAYKLSTISTTLTGFQVLRISLSHHNIFLTGIILLLVLACAGCGTVWVVLALQARTYVHLLTISPLTITINALSTSADIIITSTLCFILHRTRPVYLG
ncbi:hypothetical protein B0H13DRAFT_2365447 [Mycena leptocephala]|nr:hypothetical protein B0H13DRAFT_2365447 [Mycena leptocephala]